MSRNVFLLSSLLLTWSSPQFTEVLLFLSFSLSLTQIEFGVPHMYGRIVLQRVRTASTKRTCSIGFLLCIWLQYINTPLLCIQCKYCSLLLLFFNMLDISMASFISYTNLFDYLNVFFDHSSLRSEEHTSELQSRP